MKLRVFLDTNISIYAFESPESNSSRITELLNNGQIEAIISERVLREIHVYFNKFHDKDLAATFRGYLLKTCTVVFQEDVKKEMALYKNLIKDKDLDN